MILHFLCSHNICLESRIPRLGSSIKTDNVNFIANLAEQSPIYIIRSIFLSISSIANSTTESVSEHIAGSVICSWLLLFNVDGESILVLVNLRIESEDPGGFKG